MKKFSAYSVAAVLVSAAVLAGCPRPPAVDYHTQTIEAGENDLQGRTLLFMPDSSINFYSRTILEGVTTFPVDPASGTVIDFEDADPFVVNLAAGFEVLYYGQAYDTLFIGSDGTISFGREGAGNTSLVAHFAAPQVSLLPVDATEGNGVVSFEIFSNEIVVTFANVFVGNATNSFQAEFFISGAEDADLALSYPVASINSGGVIGLSNGQLAGANQAQIDAFLEDDFAESDLTTNNTGSAKLGA